MKNNLFLVLFSCNLFSQVLIITMPEVQDAPLGSNPINPNAILELRSANKGLLIPRVPLESTTLSSPLSAHVEGMVLYNTSGANGLVPGFYYNDGSKWVHTEGPLPGYDETNDAFTNNVGATRVQLATLSNGVTVPAIAEQFNIQDDGRVAIAKLGAGQELDVNGDVRLEMPSSTSSSRGAASMSTDENNDTGERVSANLDKVVSEDTGRLYDIYYAPSSDSANFQGASTSPITVNSNATVIWHAGGCGSNSDIVLPNSSSSIGRSITIISAGNGQQCDITGGPLITGSGTTITAIPGGKRATITALKKGDTAAWYVINKDF